MAQGKSALSIVHKYAPHVKRVIDGGKYLNIKISARDCRYGKCGSVNNCAIAKACKRTYDDAIISKKIAYLIEGTTAYRFFIPSSLRRQIVLFDRDNTFTPGQYELLPPRFTQKLEAVRTASKKQRSEDKTAIRNNHRAEGIRSL